MRGILSLLVVSIFFFGSFQNHSIQINSAQAVSDAGSGGDDAGNNDNIHDQIPKKSQSVLSALRNLSTMPLIVDIYPLRAINNPEVPDTLIWRLNKELKMPSATTEDRSEFIMAMLMTLTEFAHDPNFDLDVLVDKSQVVNYICSQVIEVFGGEQNFPSYVKPMLQALKKQIENYRERSGKGINLRDKNYKTSTGQALIVPKTAEFVSPEDSLKKFRDILDSKIVEQPEVVEALYDLEFESQIKGPGNVGEPPFFYLMGLSGVGKDTSAEAYVDALYGANGKEHLYSVPVQRSKADAWALLGSATGYIGSDKIPDFIRFLVKHSGGKYVIQEKGQVILENPDWKPGEVLDGYFSPEKSVVFLNEFHDWSSEAKSILLKESLEKGIFKINNPGNGGVSVLKIPGIRFFAASNEGIDLYTNRDQDGARYGEPLSYEEMLSRWEKVHSNKDLLKQTIAKTASKNASGVPGDQKLGMPEEMLNRIHPSRLILMKPISPEGLRRIVRMQIESVANQLQVATGGAYGAFKIEPTDTLVKFIQEYDYSAEDGARLLKDKIRSLMEYPFYQALKEGKFTPEDLKDGVTIDLKRNDDNTYSLVLLKGNGLANQVLREQPIVQTFKERENNPMPDAKIDQLSNLAERLKNQVFGADAAIDMISKSMLLSAEARYVKRKKWGDHEKASSYAFFGPSSTGKSEMAKALVRELYPEYGELKRVDFDFNKVKSDEDMREFIWGRKVGREVHPSEFMKKWDQNNGDLLLVIEEGTNVPKDLLRSLYDLFRESHPKFADGKDRPMTNVTIIMTGNAGIEWYSQVPKNVPIKVQMAAWQKIYEESMKDPEFQRATLEKYLPEPLINRIGQTNIVWFAPLSFKAVRELTMFKLATYLEKLKVSDGRRGWDVGFRNQEEMMKFVEAVEKEAFYLHEQGASIDRYIDDQIQKGLRSLLLTSKVPTGTRVALVARDDQSDEVIKKQEAIMFDVIVEGRSDKLQLKAYAQKREVETKENPNDVIATAAHEAGHEIVNKILLGNKYTPDFITIIPGVDKIGGQWIYYLGLASREEAERLGMNYDAGIRLIAGLMAGFEGERAVSIENRDGAGKSNDISRATAIAESMVTKWGLVPEWGLSTDDPKNMSDSRKKLKEDLVNDILEKGRLLAEKVLAVNKELHFEMTRRLAKKGELKKEDLIQTYKEFKTVDPQVVEKKDKSVISRLVGQMFTNRNHDIQITPELNLKPEELANLDAIVEKQRQDAVLKARIAKPLPIFENFGSQSAIKNDGIIRSTDSASNMCADLFR